MYNGMWDCVVQTVKFEGVFKGLYKGMGAPLVGVSPIFALMFLGNDFGKKIQQSHPGKTCKKYLKFFSLSFQIFLPPTFTQTLKKDESRYIKWLFSLNPPPSSFSQLDILFFALLQCGTALHMRSQQWHDFVAKILALVPLTESRGPICRKNR